MNGPQRRGGETMSDEKDTPDALAYAHWYEAARAAQKEVARLTWERDEALRERDAARREKTHRFALRRELEETLGVGDSYADGALEAAVAKIAEWWMVEAERDRLRTELTETVTTVTRLRGELASVTAERHEMAQTISATRAAAYGGELTRLRAELVEALAGREREYQRAEASDEVIGDAWKALGYHHDHESKSPVPLAEAISAHAQRMVDETCDAVSHDADALLAATVWAWSDSCGELPCPHCWRPCGSNTNRSAGQPCGACWAESRLDVSTDLCTRCAAPAKTTEGGERLCWPCAYDTSTAGCG